MSKNVFVTGGAGGLGLAIVSRHLAKGDAVWATDIAENPEIEALRTESKKLAFIKCDISNTANVSSAIGNLPSEIGKLDYLYSCAGIYRFEDKAMLPETNLDNAASMYEINAVGFLRVIQALFPAFQEGSVMRST